MSTEISSTLLFMLQATVLLHIHPLLVGGTGCMLNSRGQRDENRDSIPARPRCCYTGCESCSIVRRTLSANSSSLSVPLGGWRPPSSRVSPVRGLLRASWGWIPDGFSGRFGEREWCFPWCGKASESCTWKESAWLEGESQWGPPSASQWTSDACRRLKLCAPPQPTGSGRESEALPAPLTSSSSLASQSMEQSESEVDIFCF